VVVGVMRIELFIPESGSLKTKRFAVKSIKDRLKSKFNISVAEVDNGDKWQRASIGICGVSNDRQFLETMLNKALDLVYGDRRVQVIDSSIMYY
jgi:uncharacterized protein YlxP (DUF503 family)